ncbi:YitT family protein [Lactobacillus corticis]|uniref:YitT family membrane protein n=1 Tax=Lactobacillus corticis TaxID=2201249 RepID=A0A916VJ51_9LACO|nr:YitT family protein [Lactobacillus corticis]GFZ27059.1 YitT family membrane protein [Lactobacillus corticis]
MDNIFEQFNRRYNFVAKLSAAFFYSIAVAVALNFFWEPGHMYSSGVTGFAQILHSVSAKYLPVTWSTSVLYFLLNAPLFVLAWFKIGKKFTFFTVVAVVLGSVMMRVIHPLTVNMDPLLCAIFGGVINGIGTGFALKNGISTGGLDIIGIVIRMKTGTSYGKTNIIINLIIVACAGFIFGWTRALYTALNIFINGQVIDGVYTKHQKMQMMIITEHPNDIIDGVQKRMHRGITIIHDAEGAYGHAEKTILITIIDRADMYDIVKIIKECDEYSFVSVSEGEKVFGRFKEQEIV